ncbi:nucleoside phosphorylase domain-containing protein [Xylaria telfairii]|nr:nucleoside phosphorylase domain-containing protein [Xylaria telfairii]
MSQKKLERTDYDVAWICPVPNVELTPSRLMLDNEHQTPSYDTDYDDNTYIFGEMSGHHVVIATLPKGSSANVNASRVAGPLFRSFPRIRMTLLVGIGGGIPRAPSETPHASISDVHVGDVVVGAPGDGYPGVIYYDFGRSYADGSFEMLGQIDRPDHVLLSALEKLCSDHECRQSKFHEHSQMLHRLGNGPRFAFPGLEHDQLFRPGYLHVGDYGSHCRDCDRAQLVNRPARTEQDAGKMIFHRGRIATGNSVVQDGEKRDRIRQQCMGALCIEMEAAGIDVNRPCLVIRGISDYADSHKSGVWRSYAAAQAAVFARELLCKVSARSRYSTG